MTYADPFVCPSCSSRLSVDSSACPSCGLLLRVPLAGELLETLRTADRLLVRLRALSDEAVAPPPPLRPPPVVPPVMERRPATTMSSLSVPKILLGLGALCLLVAAVAFLVAAWSWLGVGGRTAVLVGLTLLSGGLGVWLGRRELRIAGEALTTVALGLLVLDVLGADSADWLGDLSADQLLCVVGATVLAAGLALAHATRLVAPQVAAVLGLSALGGAILEITLHGTLVPTAVVLAYAVLATLARSRRLVPMLVGAGIAAAGWWFGLLADGVGEATLHPSLHGLWVDGHGASLLVASLLTLLPIPFLRAQVGADRVLVTVATVLLTLTASVPALDEGATVVGVVALAVLVVWTLASVVLPASWRPVAWAPMAIGALAVGSTVATLATEAVANAAGTADPFTGSVTSRLGAADPSAAPILLPVGVVALVGALLTVLPRRIWPRPQVTVTALAFALLGLLALYPAPIWTLVAGLTVLGVALVAESLRHEGELGLGESVGGVAVAALGLVVALPSDVLTLAVLVVLVVLSVVLHWWGWVGQEVLGGLVLPISGAGALWVAGEVADVDPAHRGVPILLVLGLLAIWRSRPDIEGSAAAAAATAGVVAVGYAEDVSVSLALHLTVAGVLVSASALINPHRRILAWPGGLLLAAATWVRLWDLGVTAPEPYTLPSAVALVVVGLVHLRRSRDLTTWGALAPGLLLGTVPTLLWVIEDPLSMRAVLLGLGCLGLMLAGAHLRWSAPLLVGAAVGAVIALCELAPYVAQVPQWAVLGSAGTLLTVVGITWERRLRDLRAAGAYLGSLR